jgi:phytoene dehydrogenase-like protein
MVIGAGHNGLVAAARRADAGWDVLLLEAQPAPGGVVKSAELFPGYVSEQFSAFYPLSAVRRRCVRLNCRTRTAVIVRARCGWPRPVRRR